MSATSSYRELQLQLKRLGLPANGKRAELEARLKQSELAASSGSLTGQRVVIVGASKQLNGLCGLALSFDSASGRYKVTTTTPPHHRPAKDAATH